VKSRGGTFGCCVSRHMYGAALCTHRLYSGNLVVANLLLKRVLPDRFVVVSPVTACFARSVFVHHGWFIGNSQFWASLRQKQAYFEVCTCRDEDPFNERFRRCRSLLCSLHNSLLTWLYDYILARLDRQAHERSQAFRVEHNAIPTSKHMKQDAKQAHTPAKESPPNK